MSHDALPPEIDALDAESPQATPTKLPKSGLISKVLAPAIQLWLRSQVEHLQSLEIQIAAGDRQILSGKIPQVRLKTEAAIYRGIHLSWADITGQNIQVNLGQVMRGKALKLLAPIPIDLHVVLQEADLNASLNAPLLGNAVGEFLQSILDSGMSDLTSTDSRDLRFEQLEAKILDNHITLGAGLVGDSGQVTPIALRTSLGLVAPNQLQLVSPQWLPHVNAKRGLPLSDLEQQTFDLGTDTAIEQLQIETGKITLRGRLQVNP